MKVFVLITLVFLAFYFIPFGTSVVDQSILNGFYLLQEYAREHVLLCLVPAFLIAGTITVMLKKDAVLKLLGPRAKRVVSYPVAAVSGGILAVCSCTILPIFGGIYRKGAGIGPAVTFLFSGPAINIAAIFLTARVLGWGLGITRIVATLSAAVLVGIIMELLFQKEQRSNEGFMIASQTQGNFKGVIFFAMQILFLVLSGLKLAQPVKNLSLSAVGLSVAGMAIFGFSKEETKSWLMESWDFAKKILPYLFIGVFLAGLITKSLPQDVVVTLLGKNNFVSTLIGSVIGSLMYFATLTEVPIVQALTDLGMAKGPTLALLMAGNTLSLPSMIVITKLLGKKKAFTYFSLVVIFSTIFGMIYGAIAR